MPITFDRSVCCDLNETVGREWLVTNGLGGYAAGTVAGVLTRLELGLLVASPREGKKPQLLVAKMDEEIVFDQRTYYLGTNEYRDGTLNPAGFAHLETFQLEEGFPVFTYRLGGIDGVILEKRIWMPQGLNTTYIHYRVLRTAAPASPYEGNSWRSLSPSPHAYSRYHDYPPADQRVLSMTLLPFAAYRAYNEPQHGDNNWQFQVEAHLLEQDSFNKENNSSVAGCAVRAWDGANPYHIFVVGHPEGETTFLPTGVWYWNFLRRQDHAMGRTATDDLYLPGVFRTKLWPGEDAGLTIIITAEDLSWLNFSTSHLNRAYQKAVEHQRSFLQPERYFGEGGAATHTQPVLPFPSNTDESPQGEEFLLLLLQAGDRFLAQHTIPADESSAGHSSFFSDVQTSPAIIPAFYQMDESTRDTLIALPGLTLATQRYSEARRILTNLGRYFRQGLLPDRLPTVEHPLREEDYGSVDTTLWYFYALDQYLQVTRDYGPLYELYGSLEESITWYTQGTYNSIRVDPQDGLLEARQPGKALTWMNAFTKGAPVTPRYGKAVEVNALWYLALSLMQEWSEHLYRTGRINHQTSRYEKLRQQCKLSFNACFWYAPGGYLYDVHDDVEGNDASIRPNQLFALSLRYPVLEDSRQRTVLNTVSKHLLTPFGLRTLTPRSDSYVGHIKENLEEQGGGLHQGGAWPWLIGPYIDALLHLEGSAPGSKMKQNSQERWERVWQTGIQLLNPFREQLCMHMLGMIGSVYDGDAPQSPHAQLACACSTGEVLRVYKLLARMGIRFSDRTLSV